MILFHGEILNNKEQSNILKILEEDCLKTLNKDYHICVEQVIEACNKLYEKVINGDYNDIIMPIINMMNISYERFLDMTFLFSKESLEYKCEVELGADYKKLKSLKNGTKRYYQPLGILFHIAAGNIDGLPAYSVIEGLLSGNINILKLPTGDSGLSIKLLSELINIDPKLKDYIYVFDVPSTEIHTLQKFANIADGIVVWGTDIAVEAARKLASVTTKIISWGHKLSFSYATTNADDDSLRMLAKHICSTNQLLCSSCQGIFLDTNDDSVLFDFAKKFFSIFKEVNLEFGKTDVGMRGKNTIRIYNDLLEKDCQKIIFAEDGISVILPRDSELEISYMFRSVWIKKLPSNEMIYNLKKHKNHLQTCGLLCSVNERERLSKILMKCGLTKITNADMSKVSLGEAHDGTYPLREYTKIVEIE